MVLRPLRQLSIPDPAPTVHKKWLGQIEEELTDPKCDRYDLCRRTLFDLYYPGIGDYHELLADPKASAAARTTLLAQCSVFLNDTGP